jgi:hypothetical protein
VEKEIEIIIHNWQLKEKRKIHLIVQLLHFLVPQTPKKNDDVQE